MKNSELSEKISQWASMGILIRTAIDMGIVSQADINRAIQAEIDAVVKKWRAELGVPAVHNHMFGMVEHGAKELERLSNDARNIYRASSCT